MNAAEAMRVGKMILMDNCGRRLGDDRRSYSYSNHIPERRSDQDRRSGQDRRRKSRRP